VSAEPQTGSRQGRPGHPAAPRPAGRSGTVTLYTRPGCHLCEQARLVLERVRQEHDFELIERDIGQDEELHRRYFDRIPVIALDGVELCEHFAEEQLLREVLGARRR
jgi:glutaredoxin